MALIKEKVWKYGITVTYWMVSSFNINWNKIGRNGPPMGGNIPNVSGTTLVNIVGYINKGSRTGNINDYVSEVSLSKELPGIITNIPDIYDALKVSVPQNVLIHPVINEVKDINGNIIVPYQDAQYEVTETNWFADALDDI